jgi:hypothetical protein
LNTQASRYVPWTGLPDLFRRRRGERPFPAQHCGGTVGLLRSMAVPGVLWWGPIQPREAPLSMVLRDCGCGLLHEHPASVVGSSATRWPATPVFTGL